MAKNRRKKNEPEQAGANGDHRKETEITYTELGKFYFLNGKYEEAIAEFQKALELNPHNAEILYNLGLIYESLNDGEKASDFYEKALGIDPDYKLAREHLNRLIGLEDEGKQKD